MTTSNTPTTPQGKARKVFAQFDFKLEMERGAYYLVINDNISVQITTDEVLARAEEYDKQQLLITKKLYNMNILEEALNKVSTETLDQMEQGQTIVLNERYELYSYFDEDYFVIRDTHESVEDEIFCVQYADNNEVVYTDVYGYDEIEQSLTKTI